MKLIRYGKPGQEKPGLIDSEGKARSLADVIPDWDGAHLSPKVLAKIAKIKPEKLPLVKPSAVSITNPRATPSNVGSMQKIPIMIFALHPEE